MDVSIRIATTDDLPAMAEVIERAIAELQRAFLSPAEIGARRLFMGIDTQLLRDATYYCAIAEGRIRSWPKSVRTRTRPIARSAQSR